MRQTKNIGLSLYDSSDKMSITASTDSLNHNMEIIDGKVQEALNKEISVDKTLTVDGQAADAKVVGDKFKEVDETTSSLKEDIVKLSSDDGIKPNMIDGNEYSKKDINDNYMEKRAWYVTNSRTVGKAGSGQIAPGSETSSDVINLTNYDGKLIIGFNSSTNMYGENIIIAGDSISSGANILTYYSKNNILNNLDGLFDINNISSNYIIFDIDKFKSKYPKAIGLFINEP